MDFSFSEEQTLLRNSVAAYLADRYSFEAWRKFTRTSDGRDGAHWKQFAELGLLAAPLPEAYGGLGGGALETMIIAEEFGKALVIEPYISTAVIAGGLLARAGSETQKQEWLPKIAAGESIIAFAFAEPHGCFDLADLVTTAKKQSGSYAIDGQKSVVLGAPWADTLLVTARIVGGRRDQDGIGAFLIDKNAKGVTARDFATVDGGRASEIAFENVAAEPLGDPEGGFPELECVVDEAIAAHSAEALGGMRVLLDATLAYAKTRKQFGQPIGKFQVLQHRMVDMFVALEQSVSAVLLATLKLETPERKKWASAAKVETGKAGRFIGQQAIQIHGGMGMTDELNVGHYFKRLTMLDTLYGNVDHHLMRFAKAEMPAPL
jgi:alkylation response protein AidB-like acyl-CoA dehydrogenase